LVAVVAFVAAWGGYFQAPVRAYTSTTCPAADPYDSNGDSDALNNCLDNYEVVLLEPSGGYGYVGYIIDNVGGYQEVWYWGCMAQPYCYVGLELNENNVIAPSGEGPKPVLIADESLQGPMIAMRDEGLFLFELHNIILDGNKDARSVAFLDECATTDRGHGTNAILKGSDFQVIGVESINALCGSGFVINDGEDFEVSSGYFADNGFEYDNIEGVWADGLTVNNPTNGVVYYNTTVDNTDLGIVIRDGLSTYMAHNYVEQTDTYAFGGIHIQKCEDGCQSWDNEIVSGYDLMGFGFVFGKHPWHYGQSGEDPGDVGEVYENTIYGAVLNFAIDGITDGDFWSNAYTGHQGSQGFHCSVSVNYSAQHYGTASVEPYPDDDLHWNSSACG
jgi:hypothetical protein